MDGFSLSGFLVFIVKLIFAKIILGGIVWCIRKLRKAFKKDKNTEEVSDDINNTSDNNKS